MLNNVSIMGRLTADPELKTTTAGVSVTTVTLAVDRDYTPKGKEKEADFFNVVAWRGEAEFICKYFIKGQLMAVKGRLQQEKYIDKNGDKRSAVSVVAEHAYFCGGNQRAQEGQDARPAFKEPDVEADEEDFQETLGDDLPF